MTQTTHHYWHYMKFLLGSLLTSVFNKDKQNSSRVKMHTDLKGTEVVTKHHLAWLQDLSYMGLLHEIFVLKIISGMLVKNEETQVKVCAPILVEHHIDDKKVSVTTQKAQGTTLSSCSNDVKKTVLKSILHFMGALQDAVVAQKLLLPQRSNWYFLLYGVVVCVRACLRDTVHIQLYIYSLWLFLRTFQYERLFVYTPHVVHRDLFSSNIIWNSNTHTATVLDWESTLFSDRLYEFSLLPWQYAGELSYAEVWKLIEEVVPHNRERKHCFSLGIFACLQARAIEDHESDMYANALETLLKMRSDAHKHLTSLSVYEYVNGIGLYVVYGFNRLFAPHAFYHARPIIMCYHSVGDTGWRFSTPVDDFEKQIAWLSAHFKLVSLEDIIAHPQPNQVAITFDDGYLDVYQAALPILEKYGAVATVFVLGNPSQPNRVELDNNLPLMSVKQIKDLAQRGWGIGFHTMTHIGLAGASEAELSAEIVEGKNKAEKIYGMPFTMFAYPKGFYSTAIVNMVEQSGIIHAFTVDGGTYEEHHHPLYIPRIAVDGGWSQIQFQASVTWMGLILEQVLWQMLLIKDKVWKNI